MTEAKHFKYEGHVDLRTMHDQTAKWEVREVEFLTPARVKIVVNGKETFLMVNIDIINRKVYDANGDTTMSDLVFNHLDAINTLPDDFFAAPDDLREKAREVEEERIKNSNSILEDYK